MTDKWVERAAKLARELPPDAIESLALAFEAGKAVSDRRAAPLLEVLAGHPVPGSEVAAALRSASIAASIVESEQSLDLAWTGPTPSSVSVRRMEQAFCELIETARERLFVVSYVAYKTGLVFDALRAAAEHGVALSFLLEREQSQGGAVSIDSVEQLRPHFPQAAFYVWDGSGAVHAKCAVADASVALVTSANLTGKAMNDNMELGVLVRGGPLPRKLAAFLDRLVLENIVRKLV